MLIIRQEQIDALIMGTDEEFVSFLIGHIKEKQPELETVYDNETLRKMVKNGIERAKSHGFKTAEDLTIFVSLMFRIAPNFDEQSDIKAIVDNEDIAPEKRFAELESPIFPKKAWDEAAKNYDKNAWLLKFEMDVSN